eukprot:8964776-Ditylum_brightwellii.AAC.1
MCVPIDATTNDGAHNWQSKGCSGIVGEIIVCQDDGPSGMDSMLFGWKITTKTGNSLALQAGLAFGQSSSF